MIFLLRRRDPSGSESSSSLRNAGRIWVMACPGLLFAIFGYRFVIARVIAFCASWKWTISGSVSFCLHFSFILLSFSSVFLSFPFISFHFLPFSFHFLSFSFHSLQFFFHFPCMGLSFPFISVHFLFVSSNFLSWAFSFLSCPFIFLRVPFICFCGVNAQRT